MPEFDFYSLINQGDTHKLHERKHITAVKSRSLEVKLSNINLLSCIFSMTQPLIIETRGSFPAVALPYSLCRMFAQLATIWCFVWVLFNM